MNHLNEEQLVLHYYGEDPGASVPVDRHLSECSQCRAEYGALQLVLNTVNAAPVPDRSPYYGSEVWRRIQPKVRKRNGPPWWMLAPVAAMLMLAAFFAGRFTQPAFEEPAQNGRAAGGSWGEFLGLFGAAGSGLRASRLTTASNSQVRERILLVAVGDHLDRSQMVLAELSNAPDGKGKVDISGERQLAEDLLDDNRLYRQTAHSTGDAAVAGVLDDLERTLIEIANSPSEVSKDQFEHLRQEIQDRGLLFKVRVVGSQVRRESGKKL